MTWYAIVQSAKWSGSLQRLDETLPMSSRYPDPMLKRPVLAGYGLPLLLGKIAFVMPNGLGVPDPITVVVVLGYRLISFWIPSLSGFPIAIYLQRSKKVAHG